MLLEHSSEIGKDLWLITKDCLLYNLAIKELCFEQS